MPQVKELPWLDKSAIPADARIVSDPWQSLIDKGAAEAVSDTGEAARNWRQGTFTINTPTAQAAMGWIGGKRFNFREVEIAATTRNATVSVQSLDGNPINRSGSILISLGARSTTKGGNRLPFYSEPVEGNLLVTAPKGLRLRAWDAGTGKMREVAAPYAKGRYSIALDKLLRSYWLMLDARTGE